MYLSNVIDICHIFYNRPNITSTENPDHKRSLWKNEIDDQQGLLETNFSPLKNLLKSGKLSQHERDLQGHPDDLGNVQRSLKFTQSLFQGPTGPSQQKSTENINSAPSINEDSSKLYRPFETAASSNETKKSKSLL